MLLAELRGKRYEAVESNEDWLTSAIFGQLRLLSPDVFWLKFLERATTCDGHETPLAGALQRSGVDLANGERPHVSFWPDCGTFGEPDLVLRFKANEGASAIVLIEVKLHSGKSGVGPDDQLAKYLRMLDTPDIPDDWKSAKCRTLVYLTQSYGFSEVRESIAAASDVADAEKRMFTLRWRDVLEIAYEAASAKGTSPLDKLLLEEVGLFLKRRGFERFRKFAMLPTGLLSSGRFYFPAAFRFVEISKSLRGGFYE